MIKKTLSYNVYNYVFKLTLIFAILVSILFFMGNKNNPLSSYIYSVFSFYLITIFSSYLLIGSNKYNLFFSLVYFFKILIGLVHYLYFIDSNYFKTGIYRPLTFEYEGVFEQILINANDKLHNGLFYYNFIESGILHQELLSFISIPFVFFGSFFLTISPINTFFSIIISINFYIIGKKIFDLDDFKSNLLIYFTSFFPITLISSLLYRDIVGLSLMTIGVTSFLLSKKWYNKLFFLVLGCFLFYLQRTIYPLLFITSFIISELVNNSNFIKNKFYKFFLIIFSLILIPIISKYSITETNQIMLEGGLNVNIFSLPLKIIIGLIGPFPWTNFLMYDVFPAYAYQLQDYLQAILNISIVVLLLTKVKLFFNRNLYSFINLIGFSLILSGLFNSHMHMSYVAIGFLFLIPFLIKNYELKVIRSKIYFSLIFLIILNCLILFILGNLSITSLWK